MVIWEFKDYTDEELLDIKEHLNALKKLGFEVLDEWGEMELKEELKKREFLGKLTEVEFKIFSKVVNEYKKRGLIADEDYLISIIKLGNTDGDGFKRISRFGEDKTFLVPIEDIILRGVKATELNKYEVEKK